MNIVVDELPSFGAAHYVCAEPRWMTRLAFGLCLLFGCALACLALSADGIAAVVILAPGVACAVLAAASRPAPIHYAGDAHGLYFPACRPASVLGRRQPRSWLFVPWAKVSRIGVQPLLDDSGRKGVVLSLRASDAERQLYFPRAVALDRGAAPRGDTDGLILVGYPGAGKSPYQIVSILCALQRQPEQEKYRIDSSVLSVR